MKFYNREIELKLLDKTRKIAFNNHSQMTVLTGRRRIGKTKLILKSCEETPTVYFFVGRSNEAQLCSQFAIASKETAYFCKRRYTNRSFWNFRLIPTILVPIFHQISLSHWNRKSGPTWRNYKKRLSDLFRVNTWNVF